MRNRTDRADPISRDVFQHQVSGIAEEMSMALRRTAYSSMIWHMYDYSCALFTPAGELLAQAQTIPAQLGIMATALQHVSQAIPLDSWRPGDVIVCNDPYRGCTHTPDIVLFSPIIHADALIGIAATIAHHADIGGKVPCTVAPDNLEVFAEGLLLPPLKLVEQGVTNPVICDIVAANVRNPNACLGDLRAQIAGCRTGERRLSELAEHYGHARFFQLADNCLDYTETYFRRAISALQDGCQSAEILMEDGVVSDQPMRLRATVTVQGDTITVDFTGTEEQRDNALNCPYASTLSMVQYALKCILAPDIAQNEGCVRTINIHVPEGSLLNPKRPAAVGNRHFSQQAVADVVLKAMVAFSPERSAAGCQISFPCLRAGGFDDRSPQLGPKGEKPYYIIADILGGGMGGSRYSDGMNTIDTHGGNCRLLSAEIMEDLSPFRVLRSELVAGSGGAGKQRGGLAMYRDYELLAEKAIFGGYVQQTEDTTTPWGVAAGERGQAASCVLNPDTETEHKLGSKTVGLTIRKGTVIRIASAGGGGWGDPSERDPGLLARDQQEGYVKTGAVSDH